MLQARGHDSSLIFPALQLTLFVILLLVCLPFGMSAEHLAPEASPSLQNAGTAMSPGEPAERIPPGLSGDRALLGALVSSPHSHVESLTSGPPNVPVFGERAFTEGIKLH